MNLGNTAADPFCHRCWSEPTYAVRNGVCLCRGCAEELLGPMQGSEAQVGQAEEAGFFCAIENTAGAAGEIAKTVKVVAVIGAVGVAAWVGYALWKASREAAALQHGAQQAFLAHPELLKI